MNPKRHVRADPPRYPTLLEARSSGWAKLAAIGAAALGLGALEACAFPEAEAVEPVAPGFDAGFGKVRNEVTWQPMAPDAGAQDRTHTTGGLLRTTDMVSPSRLRRR